MFYKWQFSFSITLRAMCALPFCVAADSRLSIRWRGHMFIVPHKGSFYPLLLHLSNSYLKFELMGTSWVILNSRCQAENSGLGGIVYAVNKTSHTGRGTWRSGEALVGYRNFFNTSFKTVTFRYPCNKNTQSFNRETSCHEEQHGVGRSTGRYRKEHTLICGQHGPHTSDTRGGGREKLGVCQDGSDDCMIDSQTWWCWCACLCHLALWHFCISIS